MHEIHSNSSKLIVRVHNKKKLIPIVLPTVTIVTNVDTGETCENLNSIRHSEIHGQDMSKVTARETSLLTESK